MNEEITKAKELEEDDKILLTKVKHMQNVLNLSNRNLSEIIKTTSTYFTHIFSGRKLSKDIRKKLFSLLEILNNNDFAIIHRQIDESFDAYKERKRALIKRLKKEFLIKFNCDN